MNFRPQTIVVSRPLEAFHHPIEFLLQTEFMVIREEWLIARN